MSFLSCSRSVDSAKETSRSVDDDIEREHSINWVRIGRDFPVKKLSQVAVEGAIRAAQKIISKLEIGN